MSLIGLVAEWTKQVVGDLLRLPEREFAQMVPVEPLARPENDDSNRPSGSGSLLPVQRADTTTGDPNNMPFLDDAGLAVLIALGNEYPKLLKNVEIETIARLSKQTVSNAVTDLIDKKLATRPKGQRKGTTVTAAGLALFERIRNSSADHP
jgi:hypothetical protein